MAGRFCMGCNKNIHGMGKFCTKKCKLRYDERMEQEANRDKNKEVTVKLNHKTWIIVKDKTKVEAAVKKYTEYIENGTQNLVGYKRLRGVALG